jgi:hypothetical protein
VFHPGLSTIRHASSTRLLSFIPQDPSDLDSFSEPEVHGDPHNFNCHLSTPPDHRPSHTSSLVQIPVEEFSRRTAQQRLVKYGRRRRRAIELPVAKHRVDDNDELFSPQPLKRRRNGSPHGRSRSSSPFCPSPINLTKTKKSSRIKQSNKKKKVKSLAERLIQASLLSHGNPAECLLNPNLLNSDFPLRPPIDFVPETQNSKPTPHRAWTLVDPKKAAPFRSASFRTRVKHEKVTTAVTKHRPFSEWLKTRNSIEQEASPKNLNIKRQAQARKTAANPLQCPPLVLISLEDAEAAYSRSKRDKFRRPEQEHTVYVLNKFR